MPLLSWEHTVRLVRGRLEPAFMAIGNPVRCGLGRPGSVALTFDDGPSPGTLPLLEILAKARVRATFFQCGLNVLRHPEIARAALDAGHELGNHTYSHARLAPQLGWKLNLRSPGSVFREFADAQQVFRTVLEYTPAVMRAPYGFSWFGIGDVEKKLRMRNILWTAIGHDWEWTAGKVINHILSTVSFGAILCLHDGRELMPSPDIATTLETAREIIPILLDQGYKFETVSDLLQMDRIVLQSSGNIPGDCLNDAGCLRGEGRDGATRRPLN